MASIKGKPKLNPGQYTEALDRCWIVQQMMQNILLEHPVIANHKAWAQKIESAQTIIGEVYQEIGART